jgi:DNA (cytosine-5)-methyltransferase 1
MDAKHTEAQKDTLLTYIDLFAGAGGLSEGFIRNGFLPIAHVEMDKDACLTLQTRLAFHYLKKHNKLHLYLAYLQKQITREELYEEVPKELLASVVNETISEKTLPSIFSTIDTLCGNQTVDVIIGGPPCQAYSLIGRAADKNKMRNDPRKFLYKHYATFLERYKPKMFVFENVPGLLSSGGGKYLQDMIALFETLGYTVQYKEQNAATFGVVQSRRRIIILGWKQELNISYPDFKPNPIEKKVQYVLEDLPHLHAGEIIDVAYYTTEKAGDYLKNAGIRNGLAFTTQHITRPHNDSDLKIYQMVIDEWKHTGNNLKYSNVPEMNRTQKNIDAFLDRFKVVKDDTISHTMIAHIAKDGHHYIHPDKKQLRSISVREAARIQSFPDDYFFESSRTAAFKQIGNAVPPLMASKIAQKIKKLLR